MITKTDMKVLAAALRGVRPETQGTGHAYEAWLRTVGAVADGIEKINPRFNRTIFLKAAGV